MPGTFLSCGNSERGGIQSLPFICVNAAITAQNVLLWLIYVGQDFPGLMSCHYLTPSARSFLNFIF